MLQCAYIDEGQIMAVNTANAFASASYSVDGTAITMLTFGFTQAQLDRANRAWISAHTQHAHILFDGNTPTNTYGISVGADNVFILDGNYNIQRLQLIHGGSTVVCTIILGE